MKQTVDLTCSFFSWGGGREATVSYPIYSHGTIKKVFLKIKKKKSKNFFFKKKNFFKFFFLKPKKKKN